VQPDPQALADVVVLAVKTALAPVQATLAAVQTQVATLERRVQDDAASKELGALRERVAVVESRPPVPGPPGAPGPAGQDGQNGAPGTPGLSFEGVYQDGKSYDLGHLVTYGGSSWHCNEPTTTKPGDGSKAWTLMVKRGRDGKDGHP
jgi:hypothetical protein